MLGYICDTDWLGLTLGFGPFAGTDERTNPPVLRENVMSKIFFLYIENRSDSELQVSGMVIEPSPPHRESLGTVSAHSNSPGYPTAPETGPAESYQIDSPSGTVAPFGVSPDEAKPSKNGMNVTLIQEGSSPQTILLDSNPLTLVVRVAEDGTVTGSSAS